MEHTPYYLDTTTPCFDGEVWKDIIGHEGLYQVSNYGRVKSLDRHHVNARGFNCFFPSVILKQLWIAKRESDTCKSGELSVCLRYLRKGKRRTAYVQKLVAEAFLKEPEHNDLVIDHIDDDPRNNVFTNLQYTDRRQVWNTGQKRERCSTAVIRGMKNKRRPIAQIDPSTNAVLKTFESCGDVQRALGFNRHVVANSACNRNGRGWLAYGYRWKWINN